MEFKVWKTIICDKNCVLERITQDENGKLSIHIKHSEQDLFELNVVPEIFEVGSEQHYFGFWEKLNTQNMNKPLTTLIVKNSEWIDQFSYVRDNKMDFKHYLIIGIDKVVSLISELEPIIKKK